MNGFGLKNIVNTECIGVCEECQKTFNSHELNMVEPTWGHMCKMKKYKEQHYCESYVKLYEPKEPK